MNDYIIGDKRYDEAIRNLKSILFDVVALEETKLNDIEKKIDAEFNDLVKEGLRKIYFEQESTLRGVLKVTNELSGLLMRLDMYSRQLRSLESGKVSDAIKNTEDQNVEDAYKDDVVVSNAMRDDVAHDMISSVNELNIPLDKKNEMVEDIQTIQGGLALDDEVKEENSEVNLDSVSQEEVSQDVAPVDDVVPMVNNVVATDEPVSVVETPVVDINFGGGSMFDDPNATVQEVVPNVVSADGIGESPASTVTEATNDVVMQDVVNNDGDILPPLSVSLPGEPVAEAAKEGTNRFVKSGVEPAKAILTTNTQVTKLRESRSNQAALLVARGLLAQNPLAAGTVAALDKAMANNQVAVPNEAVAVSNDAAMEGQLVNAGLLEATAVDKQKQIEAMMEQANNLYREGNVAAAQELYDKISNLNKELQSSQSISK